MTPRSVLRYKTWTMQPDRQPDAAPARYTMQCALDEETSPTSEDFAEPRSPPNSRPCRARPTEARPPTRQPWRGTDPHVRAVPVGFWHQPQKVSHDAGRADRRG